MPYHEEELIKLYYDDIRSLPIQSSDQIIAVYKKLKKVSSIEARNLLTQGMLLYVTKIARKYIGRGLSLVDLIQEGNLGLLEAAEEFDVNKGSPFLVHARYYIRAYIIKALQVYGHVVKMAGNNTQIKVASAIRKIRQNLNREPVPDDIVEKTGFSLRLVKKEMRFIHDRVSYSLSEIIPQGDKRTLLDLLSNQDELNPEQYTEAVILYRRLKNEVINFFHSCQPLLSTRNYHIMLLRYGLDGTGDSKDLTAIGELFGLRKQRIHQIMQENWSHLCLRYMNRSESWVVESLSKIKILQELLSQEFSFIDLCQEYKDNN